MILVIFFRLISCQQLAFRRSQNLFRSWDESSIIFISDWANWSEQKSDELIDQQLHAISHLSFLNQVSKRSRDITAGSASDNAVDGWLVACSNETNDSDVDAVLFTQQTNKRKRFFALCRNNRELYFRWNFRGRDSGLHRVKLFRFHFSCSTFPFFSIINSKIWPQFNH